MTLANDTFTGVPSTGNVVMITGLHQPFNKDLLELYFTNKEKSGGGKIVQITNKEQGVFITFV